MANAYRPNNRLRNARIEQGFTQYQLAEIIGVDLKTIQRWEQGTIRNPRPYALRRLCKELHNTPEALGFSDLERPEEEKKAAEKKRSTAAVIQALQENHSSCLLLVLLGSLILLLLVLLATVVWLA